MPRPTLRNGIQGHVASVPQEDHPGENTVAVIQSGGSIPWVLHFWARFGGFKAYVGSVRTFANPKDRVVAILSLPGATQYECRGQGNTSDPDEIGIYFEGIEAKGGPWGVQPMHGSSVQGARSYRVATGINGPVVITGEVFGWACSATAAGASVSVVAGPALSFGPIACPPNDSIRGNCMGIVAPVSTWVFANTDLYFIEYVPPGENFDG